MGDRRAPEPSAATKPAQNAPANSKLGPDSLAYSSSVIIQPDVNPDDLARSANGPDADALGCDSRRTLSPCRAAEPKASGRPLPSRISPCFRVRQRTWLSPGHDKGCRPG